MPAQRAMTIIPAPRATPLSATAPAQVIISRLTHPGAAAEARRYAAAHPAAAVRRVLVRRRFAAPLPVPITVSAAMVIHVRPVFAIIPAPCLLFVPIR